MSDRFIITDNVTGLHLANTNDLVDPVLAISRYNNSIRFAKIHMQAHMENHSECSYRVEIQAKMTQIVLMSQLFQVEFPDNQEYSKQFSEIIEKAESFLALMTLADAARHSAYVQKSPTQKG